MKFWKYLRWAATAMFISILVASWLGSDSGAQRPTGVGAPARTAPAF